MKVESLTVQYHQEYNPKELKPFRTAGIETILHQECTKELKSCHIENVIPGIVKYSESLQNSTLKASNLQNGFTPESFTLTLADEPISDYYVLIK